MSKPKKSKYERFLDEAQRNERFNRGKVDATGRIQAGVRIHANDYRAIKKFLVDEHWNFNEFVVACVESYLARDPLFLKTLSEWRFENERPGREGTEDTALSPREKQALMKEIEDAG